MKNQLLRLTFIRKRERKSLLLIVCILIFTSFIDDLAIAVSANLGVSFKSNSIVSIKAFETNTSLSTAKSSEEITSRTRNTVSDSMQKMVADPIDTIQEGLKKLPKESSKPLKVYKIDPNNPVIEDLISIGIPSKVAYTWKKYTDAGGTFYNKEGLLKIYGMNEEHLNKIKSNMIFPQKLKRNPREDFVTIYINQADASQFSRISGIGPTLSGRIVKFRDRLGGFHSVAQLYEVYGIDPELIQKNEDSFLIEKEVQKININTSNEEQLAAHIYCTYRIAKAIINYRLQHGNFTGPEGLNKLRIIDNEWIAKISPYLEY